MGLAHCRNLKTLRIWTKTRSRFHLYVTQHKLTVYAAVQHSDIPSLSVQIFTTSPLVARPLRVGD